MRQNTILILGNYDGDSILHLATRQAILDTAATRRVVVNTRWMGPDELALYPGMVAEASAVVLAPPGRRGSRALPEPVLAALTLVRERDLPFLATGETHGLVFIEAARNILGKQDAGSTAFEEDVADPVVHRIGEDGGTAQRRTIDLEISSDLAPWYGSTGRVQETTDIRFGLNPDYAQAMTDAGFLAAGVDRQDGRPWLHVLQDKGFHVTAAFLPQLRSTRSTPHPLFKGLLESCYGPDR